ncbi:MAG TPA: spore coat U domain-containing protein [Rhizomicrobium sp.]|jgi:spore coat protein U-like protein|nr:spore coat U domain-containing protein [Rhizomicrobium sp.]
MITGRLCVSATVFALAVPLGACGPASAAATCNTGSNPITVSATALAFGIYSPGASSPTDSNSTVKVSCTNTKNVLPSFTVALSTGNAGSFHPRKMFNGSNTLSYNMFVNTAYSTIWGDGTSSTTTQSYSASQGLSQASFTDYGQLAPAQFVNAGAYADTITVTVAF